MKKKKILVIVGILLIVACIVWYFYPPTPAAENQELPNKFTIKERVISFVASLNITNDGLSYGRVSRNVLNLTTTFSYEDANGKLVAKGKKELISWGTKIDFYDGNDNYIGAIHEKVFESMLKVYTNYAIVDKNGITIAESEKTDLLDTDIILKDIEGNKVASLERDFINILSDTWTVEIYQREKIDTRILPIIVAYKTYSDNKKK